MDAVETLGERIRARRKELKLSQMQLAQKMNNITHSSISQWEQNLSKPNADNMYDLSIILNCDMGWLLKGVENYTNTCPVNLAATDVPILSADDIIKCDANSSNKPLKDDAVMIHSAQQKCGFYLIDDSMENDFFAGDLIIIDKTLQPVPGEFVLAQVDNAEVPIFRKLIVESISPDKPTFCLVPSAKEYPVISSTAHSINILGVMIEHRIYRRKRK